VLKKGALVNYDTIDNMMDGFLGFVSNGSGTMYGGWLHTKKVIP